MHIVCFCPLISKQFLSLDKAMTIIVYYIFGRRNYTRLLFNFEPSSAQDEKEL